MTTVSKAQSTSATTAASTSNVTISTNPSTVTNGNVVVTLSTTSGMTLQYQEGTSPTSTGWTTITSGGTRTFTTNGTINARLYDGVNGGSYISQTISNIDKVSPTISSLSAGTVTETTIPITVTASDTGTTGVTSSLIGLASIQYKLSTASSWTTISSSTTSGTTSTSKTVNVSGLSSGTSYTIQVRATDKAGNVSSTSSVTKTTDIDPKIGSYVSVLERGDYVTYNSGTWAVLHRASDSGTNSYVEIYYPSLTTTYILEGQSGYNSMISTLNAQASTSTYLNSTYAQQARHFGSHPTSPTTNATVTLSFGSTATQDTHYTTDLNGYTSAGVANSQEIWMASRNIDVYSTSDYNNFSVRCMQPDGCYRWNSLYYIRIANGYTSSYIETCGLSPVISLKSTIKIKGGSGTSSSPYTLGT